MKKIILSYWLSYEESLFVILVKLWRKSFSHICYEQNLLRHTGLIMKKIF